MKSPTRSLLAVLVAAAIASTADAADLENTLYMDLKDGRVVIEMRPDLAVLAMAAATSTASNERARRQPEARKEG